MGFKAVTYYEVELTMTYFLIALTIYFIIGVLWILFDFALPVESQPPYVWQPTLAFILLCIVLWPLRLFAALYHWAKMRL
jgi:hypothetical protein